MVVRLIDSLLGVLKYAGLGMTLAPLLVGLPVVWYLIGREECTVVDLTVTGCNVGDAGHWQTRSDQLAFSVYGTLFTLPLGLGLWGVSWWGREWVRYLYPTKRTSFPPLYRDSNRRF